MSTNMTKRCKSKLAIAVLLTLPTIVPAYAQPVEDPATWQRNRDIDLILDTLHRPIWQPVWFTPADYLGAPFGEPIYKQQPFGAQGDFRVPLLPTVAPTPVPTPITSTPSPTPAAPSPTPVAPPVEPAAPTPDPTPTPPPPPPPFPGFPIAL